MTNGEKHSIRVALRCAEMFGFFPYVVNDGEVNNRGNDKYQMTEREVIAVCESVDESTIYFRNGEGKRAWAFVVLGNAPDGSEVIADHSVTPEFASAMDRHFDIMEGR